MESQAPVREVKVFFLFVVSWLQVEHKVYQTIYNALSVNEFPSPNAWMF
jgi:hypothetical protein